MNKYLKYNLKQFQPYIPGEQPKHSGWIKLNTNENPYPPSPKVVQAISKAAKLNLQIYPDPVSLDLRKSIGKYYKIQLDRVIIGNGSDEILRMILETYINPGEIIFSLYPSYPLYKVLSEIHSGKNRLIQLTPEFDLPEWKKTWQGKILFIANPNSPTGGLFDYKKIGRICELFNGIIVLDEAYVDFAPQSGLSLLLQYPNLIITRSFSKSYSLAGLRIGFALGSKNIISELNLVKDSYNINRISQIAAKSALEDKTYFQKTRTKIIHTRNYLVNELKKMGFYIFPSEANFIFTIPSDKNGKALYQYLNKKKILVRYWDLPRLREGIRITVGTEHQINRLLEEIKNRYY